MCYFLALPGCNRTISRRWEGGGAGEDKISLPHWLAMEKVITSGSVQNPGLFVSAGSK